MTSYQIPEARVVESCSLFLESLGSYHNEAKFSRDTFHEASLLFIRTTPSHLCEDRRHRNNCKIFSDQLSSTQQ